MASVLRESARISAPARPNSPLTTGICAGFGPPFRDRSFSVAFYLFTDAESGQPFTAPKGAVSIAASRPSGRRCWAAGLHRSERRRSQLRPPRFRLGPDHDLRSHRSERSGLNCGERSKLKAAEKAQTAPTAGVSIARVRIWTQHTVRI